MQIAPSSVIHVLKDVPLDNSYEHTLYFTTKTAQFNYFSGKIKATFNNTSYQRVYNGKLKIGTVADNLYDCNYLMFNNGTVSSTFANKWFYAFIKSVNYINNETCEVEYELDVLQTWHFDYTVQDSFIEREHSLTDNIGDNLVPENVETGDYMLTSITDMFNFGLNGGYRIVMGTTLQPNSWDNPDWTADLEEASGAMFNGIYSGVAYVSFSSVGGINRFLQLLTEKQKSDAVVSLFMCPAAMVHAGDGVLTPAPTQISINNFSVTAPGTNFWSGYTVKNKKLLTSPFVTLYLTNNKGSAVEFPFEYFVNRSPGFSAWSTMSSSPGIMVYPQNYKGVSGANYDEAITITGFPMCSYNIDTYKAWLAQNSGYLLSDIVNTGLSTAVGGASSGLGAVSTVSGLIASIYHHSMMPAQAKGNTNGDVLYSNKLNSIYYGIKYIRLEFAKIIDDYFTMYGYATHRVKKPNIGTRPYWNYVKTVSANITGSIPCDDLNQIISIFDHGITFWRVRSGAVSVGDYSQDNSP